MTAMQSNSGAACTCVVTEYCYHDRDDFIVDVELFGEDELMEQVTDLLQSYRHYHHHVEDMQDEEKADFEKRAKVAEDTFRAMFRGRLENEEFLRNRPEASVLSTLQSWTHDMRPSHIEGRSSNNLSDCSSLLMNLTSELNSSQEIAIWPYVRKIK